MRSCEEIELLMNLYLDDMLPSEETRPLKEHLEKCQACRERYAQLCAMKEALGQLEVPVPEGLHGRILDYVEKNGSESAPTVSAAPKVLRPRRWYRALATVAACAVIGVAAARFVPNLTMDSAESLNNAVSSPEIGTSTDGAGVNTQSPESMVLPEAPPATPQAPGGQAAPNSPQPQAPTAEPVLTDKHTGQMAEDLPPLRQQDTESSAPKEVTIKKWLRAEGSRSALPEWVDRAYLYETQLEGQSVSYVEIAAWAEDYWTDQLTACDFTVEEMEGQDTVEDGEGVLLFFFWTD